MVTTDKLAFILLLAPLCASISLAPSVDVDGAQVQGEDWSLLHGKPEPTVPPLDPMEVRLGRALTPDEYHKWVKDHAQKAGPQKRLNKPHVMTPQAFKQWEEKRLIKPTLPPQEQQNATVRFAKIAEKTKEIMDNKVKPAIALFKQQTAEQAEEHKVWLAEVTAETERRAVLQKKADNKGKDRSEFMRHAAEERKAKILAKEQAQEDFLAQEEHKVEVKIEEQAAAMRDEAAQQAAMKAAKHWAEFHYVKAEVGRDCPDGWTPVLNRDACKLAQKVLGGVDATEWTHSFASRPGGCIWHVTSGHVAFNSDSGQLSTTDERICEKQRSASASELNRQYRKVVAAEIETEEAERDQHEQSRSEEGGPDFDIEAAEALKQSA